ncbi:MAG: TIGR04283 family arsenosugar biosynthesis glycosyltransferase [Synechococcaceae cyanobacterium]
MSPAHPAANPGLAVVIPCLQEAQRLPRLLADLAAAADLVRELVVVDGGSSDATARIALLGGARLLRCAPGRGGQLALGVAATTAPWLLLLHADARLPQGWARWLSAAIRADPEAAWAFRLAINARDPRLRLVEWAVVWRSRWRQLPYGDQGLLLSRRLLNAAGGVPTLPLLEDLVLIQRLRRHAPIRLLPVALRVDGRRWRRLGVWRTALANAAIRRAWRRGVPAAELARRYYGHSS